MDTFASQILDKSQALSGWIPEPDPWQPIVLSLGMTIDIISTLIQS